jgi:hypothetical protein
MIWKVATTLAVLGLSAFWSAIAQAQSAEKMFPLRSRNQWNLGAHEDRAVTITVDYGSGPVFRVSGFPGFTGSVWMLIRPGKLSVWARGEWKEFLRFSGPADETYDVDLPEFMGGLHQIRARRGVTVRNDLLGVTHAHAVTFMFHTGLADGGIGSMTFAPHVGPVRIQYAILTVPHEADDDELLLRKGVVSGNVIGNLAVRPLARGETISFPLSGLTASGRVIRTQAALDAFYRKLNPPKPWPKVDLTKETVVVVAIRRDWTGHEVHVTSAKRLAPQSTTILDATEFEPSGAQSWVPIYSYEIIAVEGTSYSSTVNWTKAAR